MPFDYLYSHVPINYSEAKEKARKQYLSELRKSASLLYRLNYPKEEVEQRLRGNLNWDWECNSTPEFVEQLKSSVSEIVDKVYSKPRPPEKGRRITYKDLKDI